jgi:hypothetical protein
MSEKTWYSFLTQPPEAEDSGCIEALVWLRLAEYDDVATWITREQVNEIIRRLSEAA